MVTASLLLRSYCIVTAFLATMQILLDTCIDAKSPPIRPIMALTAYLMDSQGSEVFDENAFIRQGS